MTIDREQFKYFPGVRTPLKDNRDLFRNRLTGRASIVSRDVATAAALCTRFATLDDHAHTLANLLPADNPIGRSAPGLLNCAVEGGLLVSMSAVQATLPTPGTDEDQKPISMICIATCDRPRTLNRLLTQLEARQSRMGERLQVLVADDSRNHATEGETRRVAASFSGSGRLTIRYSNRRRRFDFASRLAARTGVPRETALFTLLGDEFYRVSVGACRNSLLLETRGHRVLYMDDDVEWKLTKLPNSSEEISFSPDFWGGRFFENSTGIEELDNDSGDLLEFHERALNITAASPGFWQSAMNQATLSELTAPLIERLAEPNAKVQISQAGLLGDAATDDPLPYFLQGRHTFASLTSTQTLYYGALTNRQILRAPRGFVIAEEAACMSYCMAVDNTRGLPPFLPVERAEDFVFSALVSRCIPGALFAAIPRAVLHRPDQPRKFDSTFFSYRPGRFYSGEIIACLVRTVQLTSTSYCDRLPEMASHLESIGRLREPKFCEYLRRVLEPVVARQIQQLDALVHDRGRTSDCFWAEDVIRLRESGLRALDTGRFIQPLDKDSPSGSGVSQLQNLVVRFAATLRIWETLVEEGSKTGSSQFEQP